MAQNRFTMLPKQMGLPISPSYSYTVSKPDDDDDGDICPVCDGECTCNTPAVPPRPPTPPPAVSRAHVPLSMEELSRHYTVVTSPSTPSFALQPKNAPAPYPSLKIKVAIPPSMLAKGQGSPESSSASTHRKSRNLDEMMFVDGNAGENVAYIGPSSGAATPTPSYPLSRSTQSSVPPRKRGRPRKIIPDARDHSIDSPIRREPSSPAHKRSNPKTNIIGRQKHQIYAQKFAKTVKARPPVAPTPKPRASFKSAPKKNKAPAQKRRQRIDISSSLSDLSGNDDFGGRSRLYHFGSEGDAGSAQFPTFVSASALSSMESGADGNSSDSSSLSGFESDLSLVQEEEDFILSEMQDKMRPGRREQNNEWVIRPRRKSAGLSDAEIEVDSDATEDEEDDEEFEHRVHAGAEGQDEDGDETDPAGTQGCFRGLVTGWSDDEESNFDADVFFANLSSDSEGESSDDEAKESAGMLEDDGTSSDVSTEAELMHKREELENLPLELTENWDGQMVFTNGNVGGQAIIDIDFEVNASQFVADSETACCKNGQRGSSHHDHYMAHDGGNSDVEMSCMGSDVDDGGYEEDAGEGEGDTTDEELVGEDDLPNERAMRLFNFPLSVSAINPLSTVSPAVTPSSKQHGPRTMSNRIDSPSPADILSGKVGWDSADEMDELFDSEQRGRRLIRGDGVQSEGGSVRIMGPRQGVFVPVQETRQVVIDDSHKEIPSPHPRFNHRRRKRFNTVESLLRKHLFSFPRHPSFVPSTTAEPNNSPLKLLPSVEISASASSVSSLLNSGDRQEDDSLTTPIDLDDVFVSSFFNPDPTEASSGVVNRSGGSCATAPPDSTADESDSNCDEMKHLHRWDVISVGAFRQTRENVASSRIHDSPGPTAGWPTGHRRTPASSTDYGNVLKASPLSTMLWPTSDKNKKRRHLAVGVTSGLGVSPLIMPTRSDGDRTPTKHGQHQHHHHHHQQQQQQQNNYAPKTRKELRKERKMSKKKGYGHSPHGNHHPSHQYHSHHHHPNTKSRSSGSSQRTNFFLASVPPLNL